MESGLLASLAKPLWRLLEAKHLGADALFRELDLDPALTRQPRTRYPFEKVCRAWMATQALTDNEHIGLEGGKHFTPLDLNALGVTFLSSANLLEAFQRLDRYETLLNPDLDISIVEKDDRLDILAEVANLPENAVQCIEDTRMSIIVSLVRMANTADPLEAAFTYPAPASTGEHFAMFRCPLVFSQPVSRLSFSIADAQRPFTDANRELAISNDRFLDEMISELHSPDIITQVKRAIIEDLPSGSPGETDIARRVSVSSRTLQRKLADEGTSFRTLLMEIRRELAEKYISDRDMPLAEISYMLGFSDTSSFSRAFKRWTGAPPTTYRNNLTA